MSLRYKCYRLSLGLLLYIFTASASLAHSPEGATDTAVIQSAQMAQYSRPGHKRPPPPGGHKMRPPRGGALQNGGFGGRPPTRNHTAIQKGQLNLIPATEQPIAENRVRVRVEGDIRFIEANSISRHKTGRFPNSGNPHAIRAQSIRYRISASPRLNGRAAYFALGVFGIGINGVVLDPQAAEWYAGKHGSAWQYDPLGAAVPLGLDANSAHVQPNGTYHYHGQPDGLLAQLSFSKSTHSPLVGWALDGFPIYALIGRKTNGELSEMRSSWRLKSGNRPISNGAPGGYYDGTFIADYEYIRGTGDLDECNGVQVVTPDFPHGTYAYFLTRGFPVIPRCHSGTPIEHIGPRKRK